MTASVQKPYSHEILVLKNAPFATNAFICCSGVGQLRCASFKIFVQYGRHNNLPEVPSPSKQLCYLNSAGRQRYDGIPYFKNKNDMLQGVHPIILARSSLLSACARNSSNFSFDHFIFEFEIFVLNVVNVHP